MTGATEWQGRVGASWAREHARTDRSLAPVNAALVTRAGRVVSSPSQILDIGCGAGATSLALARHFSGAHILGIDLSADLVAAARARPDLPVLTDFRVADAGRWHDPAFRPDLLVSRHGVMFFDDPAAAFASLRDSAAPGAWFIFSCFRARADNHWASELAPMLPPVPPGDPHAPGPFAFADQDHVAGILRKAGWRAARAEPFDFPFVVGEGADPIADALDYFAAIGPAAPVLAALEGPYRTRLGEAISAVCAQHQEGGQVSFPAAAWIWSARA